MDKFVIHGQTPLQGTIPVSGSKNAALPLMAAALLADSPTRITNIPRLKDIDTFNNVLRVTGTRVEFNGDEHALRIDPTYICHPEAPYELVRKMRASFYMLGALLAKFGHARVSLPGGCAWGPRPVNLHIEGLKALGAQIEMDQGYVYARTPNGRLQGGTFTLEPSSVGATINILLGAVLAKGKTVIHNAAREPDVVALCESLNVMGARISGIATTTLTIEGVSTLQGATLHNIPDRIETGTFMLAGLMHPESDLRITGTNPDHLGSFLTSFRELGCQPDVNAGDIAVRSPEKITPVSIQTGVYPEFPTDLQAQWATLMTQAEGSSTVTDSIYPDRFSYVPELERLGAVLTRSGNRVTIDGKQELRGASVMSTDLRASVSLVLAATVAGGTSEVLRIYHLDRGYEQLEEKLNRVGARIERRQMEQQY